MNWKEHEEMAFGKICAVSLPASESTLWHSPAAGTHRAMRGMQQGLLGLPGGIRAQNVTEIFQAGRW